MNWKRCWLALVCLALIGSGNVFGQASDPSRVAEFREEQELIKELEGTIP